MLDKIIIPLVSQLTTHKTLTKLIAMMVEYNDFVEFLPVVNKVEKVSNEPDKWEPIWRGYSDVLAYER